MNLRLDIGSSNTQFSLPVDVSLNNSIIECFPNAPPFNNKLSIEKNKNLSVGYHTESNDFVICEDGSTRSKAIWDLYSNQHREYRLFAVPEERKDTSFTFEIYECFFPFVERDRVELKLTHELIGVDSDRSKASIVEHEMLLGKQGYISRNSVYLFSPNHNFFSKEALFARLSRHLEAFSPMPQGSLKEKNDSAGSMLKYLGVSYLKEHEKVKLDEALEKLFNLVYKIQSHLVKSPPSFHVFYDIKSILGESSKIVVYSYIQEPERKSDALGVTSEKPSIKHEANSIDSVAIASKNVDLSKVENRIEFFKYNDLHIRENQFRFFDSKGYIQSEIKDRKWELEYLLSSSKRSQYLRKESKQIYDETERALQDRIKVLENRLSRAK